MFGFFYSEKGLIFRSCVVCLCLINYPFVVADHHGPPKVACWKDPMSPSKWKEEHVSLYRADLDFLIFSMRWLGHFFPWKLKMYVNILLAGLFVPAVCDCLFNWLGTTHLWGIQVGHRRQGQERRGTFNFCLNCYS